MFKLLVLVAILGGGAYYWYTQNPAAFGNAGTAVSSDLSKAEGKARGLR